MKLKEIDKLVLGSKPSIKTGISQAFDQGGLRISANVIHPLNSTGIWILQQLNGTTTVQEVLKNATAQFPDVNEDIISRDIVDFVYNMYQWGYLDNVDLPAPSGYFSPHVSMTDRQVAEGRSGCGMCKETYV